MYLKRANIIVPFFSFYFYLAHQTQQSMKMNIMGLAELLWATTNQPGKPLVRL